MELVTRVRDAEHWMQLRETSEKKLVVVDAHKDWCGPCKILEPTYKRITTDIDRPEQRLVFASLNVNLGLEGIEDNGSCKPRFILFKDRKQIAEVTGANAPQLEHLIHQHLPAVQDGDDES
ncbi:hypothetical protein Poli38472_013344 [Pythium oligandrum]|uniref:Thioredoxin domain-containing protein n=1 Tax=Pythium oligandrum TaxID=41045 RepID=A0A8K1FC27_PYTOL|nr:hypothetical protein Poli38472_013344 [Pythium oligandrum]|eukprot:TMW57870.1 hypothetical protein Poli38472_013344 [Pythium oligandrum]